MKANLRLWPMLSFAVVVLALAPSAPAQFQPSGANLARSVSGQFVVHVSQTGVFAPTAAGLIRDGKLLQLEPSYAAVSCERIKQALAEDLGAAGLWRGRIYLSLQRAASNDDEITLTCERFKDGWNYRLDLPNPIEPGRFIRAIVQVLLLEQANRNAVERTAEIPLWLTEGLAQQVLSTRGSEVLLAPPQRQVNRLNIRPLVVERGRTNTATLARIALGERGPMSLEELSWPKENQLAGPDAAVFRLSAELFVAELLQFPDGRACFKKLIDELAGCYNWQTAFLRAFRPHFEGPLEIEKWWTLVTVQSTGRDPSAQWSLAESWTKLDEIFLVSAEVRQVKAELPKTTLVPLSQVLRDWDFTRQAPVLRAKLAELNLARQRIAPEILPLLDDYRRLLAGYLAQRGQPGLMLAGGKINAPTARSIQRETLKQWNILEQRREQARTAPPTATAKVGSEAEPPRP